MDIGTAKPDAATRARVPHHLIDIVDPTEALFGGALSRATRCAAIAAIRARGRVPLLVGGTMLYFKALHEGLSTLAARRSRAFARDARCARRDAKAGPRCTPSSRASIPRRPRGSRRPTRSASSARSRSTRSPARRCPRCRARAKRGRRSGRRSRVALVPPDRARAARARSRARFDAMLAAGLVDEAARRCASATRSTPDLPSMRCVGYRQAWEFLDGRDRRRELREHGHRAPRASSRNASSRGCARRRRRRSIRRARTLARRRWCWRTLARSWADAPPDSALAAVQSD